MSLSRGDIHKGAVGLEQIAACFHELASAADAIVSAQKKLSKALKESASSKGCPDIAKSALSASAWILDSVVENDAKFARAIEREYENLSADLRRWFKKLAKDEREHDDYVNIRETKIRQAVQGEAYERRALKKDIAEEYGRYVETLNTVGAEISSAQQQHSDESNQRHSAIMVSSGACLARLADASWIRTCETLRRCAPGIGGVGEARAWCESGWQGPPYVQNSSSNYGTIAPMSFEEANEQPHERQAPASRPLPDPSFRPPSYRTDGAGSVLSPPGSSRPSRTSMNGSSVKPNFQDPLARSTQRVPESSTESDLFPDYYATAAGGEAESAPEPVSPSSSSRSRSFGNVVLGATTADAPEPTPEELDIPPPTNASWQRPSSSRRASNSLHPPGETNEDEWGGGHDPNPRSTNSFSASATRRTSSPLSNRAYTPHQAPGDYLAQSSRHNASNPHLYVQQRVTSSPVAWTRPVTPQNTRAKSPTWVGKGLRRLSMPTFSNNR